MKNPDRHSACLRVLKRFQGRAAEQPQSSYGQRLRVGVFKFWQLDDKANGQEHIPPTAI
jgi:hypothetical protein